MQRRIIFNWIFYFRFWSYFFFLGVVDVMKRTQHHNACTHILINITTNIGQHIFYWFTIYIYKCGAVNIYVNIVGKLDKFLYVILKFIKCANNSITKCTLAKANSYDTRKGSNILLLVSQFLFLYFKQYSFIYTYI